MPVIIQSKEEFDGLSLWAPRGSDFYRNVEWLQNNHHNQLRPGGVILTSENGTIFTMDSLMILLSIHDQLNKINTSSGAQFNDVCLKIPTAYANDVCLETSLLELWASGGTYDSLRMNISKIRSDNDILGLLNNKVSSISGIYGTPLHYNWVAGMLEISNERVISAKALRLSFMLEAKPHYREFEGEIMRALSNISLPPGKKVMCKR